MSIFKLIYLMLRHEYEVAHVTEPDGRKNIWVCIMPTGGRPRKKCLLAHEQDDLKL